MPKGRILFDGVRKRFVTGVSVSATGEVYLALRQHVIIGEILQRKMAHHSDPQRGVFKDGHSILNYEVLDCVHPNTVRAAARRAGQVKAFQLLPNAVWALVHGD